MKDLSKVPTKELAASLVPYIDKMLQEGLHPAESTKLEILAITEELKKRVGLKEDEVQ